MSVWTDAEELFVGVLHAREVGRSEIKKLHDEHFEPRSEAALWDAQWKRDGVRGWAEALSVEGLPDDHPEVRRLEQRLAGRKDELRRLKRKLKDADKGAQLYYELAEVVRNATEPFRPAAPKLREVTGDPEPVSMVAVLSDTHADEVVSPVQSWGMEAYDFRIFRSRLERWTNLHIDYILHHLPQHEVEELWILGLGDYIHGDIHDNGPWNYFRSTPKAAIATGDALSEAFWQIHMETGVSINVVSVSGNHPRRSKRKDYAHPHDNFDYVVMTQTATRLRDVQGIQIICPEAFTAFVDIRGKVWALNHGDDVRSYAGFPWYGFSRKNNRIQALVGRKDEKVSYFVYGHYHTKAGASENDHESIHNGAFPMTDPYAQEKLSVGSEPLQRTFVVNDDQPGPILELPIYLVDEERERRVWDGEEEPIIGSTNSMDLVRPEESNEGLKIIGR